MPTITDSRRFVLSTVNALVLVAAILTATWKSTEPDPAPPVADVPLLAASSSATTSTAPPSPASTVPATTPVAPPTNAYAPEAVQEIGTIEIPKIGLRHQIFHGITMRNIDRGPSHWPGTAFPGETGNSVFAGHRVTHSHPFRNIDQLVEGDEVVFTVAGVRTRYVVTGHQVVSPSALHIVDPTPTPTATLFACHPPGSARQRYVVRLALAADG